MSATRTYHTADSIISLCVFEKRSTVWLNSLSIKYLANTSLATSEKNKKAASVDGKGGGVADDKEERSSDGATLN